MTWHKDDSASEWEKPPRTLSQEFAEAIRKRSPEAALARLLADWGARLEGETRQLGELLEAVPGLSAQWRASFENDAVDYTVDRIGDDGAAWFAWWTYLLEQGPRPTFAIVSNLDALGSIDLSAPGHLDALVARIEAGDLTLKLIVPPEARRGPVASLMTLLVQSGVEIRVGDVTGWFAVTPDRAALVPAVWGEDRNIDALVLHTPSIVAALDQLFLLRWARAAPWVDGSGPRDPVIEMLCLGRTDAQIAEGLGISIRSVRRRVAAAMQRTGCVTRMELGYRLGRESILAGLTDPEGVARARGGPLSLPATPAAAAAG